MDNLQILFDQIGELARLRYAAAERSFAVLGLNHTEARLLTLLDREGGECSQDVLSAQIVVDRTNAGRALKHLEVAGLIQRQKGVEDKRTNLVKLTLDGERIVSDVARIRAQIARTFFADLTNDEAGTVISLLSRTLGADRHE